MFRAHAYIFVWGDCMPGIVWYSLILLYGIEYNCIVYINVYNTLFCAQSYLITAKPGPPMASTLVCTYPSAKKHIHPIINLGRKRCTFASQVLSEGSSRSTFCPFADGSYHSLCGLLVKILFAETSARGHGCMSRSNPHIFIPIMQN